MGQYRSVCVTATYNILLQDDLGRPPGESRLDFSLERALQSTIHLHPGLLYGVSDESEAGVPLYRQVHHIDRQDVLNIVTSQDINSISSESTGKVADALLSQVLGEGHSELWPENKPAWRVVVLKHIHDSNNSDSRQSSLIRLDIAFFMHHAIADGLSGIGFHASFMDIFKSVLGLQNPPSWPMIFEDRRATPVAIEERVDCLSCDCNICNSPGVCDQKAWGGAPISLAPTLNFKSLVRIVTIPPKELSSVLQNCKRSKITLTGLLHSLICTTLRRGIKEDVPGFRSVTPFSVRRHTGASDRDIVNHVSFLTSYVSRTELDKIYDCELGSTAEEQHIIDLARSFGKEIMTRVKEFPHGSMVTRQNRIEDMLSHCQSQGGTERQYTYELSNLGSTSDIVAPEDSGLELEKLVFTQCGIVAGPAMAFNCASTKGGPLVIGITWERGIVEEAVVDHVARELESRLGCGDTDGNHQSQTQG
ncbi:Alcohol acetyltransferase [Fusarium torreyae]|uniref:Alcohol acetyltransferase n=1 Tax=Fusarium torreyae TaxID=1237075 RepID=A0A9W8SBU1_9HYPO|nr:Alcohol acetyltransferase [Fusarium torreyae]